MVDGRRRARVEEERQVDARSRPARRSSRARPRRAGTTSGRGRGSGAPSAANGAVPVRSSRKRTAARIMRYRPSASATPHHDGPTGPLNVPAARSAPARSTSSGSCGSGRPAGPKITVPAGRGIERRVVARADERRAGLARREASACGRARSRSRRACRSSSRRGSPPAPSRRGPAGRWSSDGSSRTTIERARRAARGRAPSGNAV